VDTSETLLSASAFLSQGFDDFATLEAERLKLSELLDRFSGSVPNLQTSSWSEVTQPPLTKEQVALELIQPFLTPNTQTFQSAESMEQAIAGGSLFNASVGSLQSASALLDLDITDEGPASALSFRVLTKFLNAEAARSMGQSGVVAQNRYWRVKAILSKGVIVAAYLSATEKHVLPEYQGTANKAYLDGIVDSLKLA
ncbi:ku80, partial [Symbiodinium necroappetens]